MPDVPPPLLELQHSGAPHQEHALVVSLAEPASAGQLEALQAIVTAWVAVGHRGGFVRPFALPTDAALRLDRWRFDDPARPAFLLFSSQLDRSAWSVLRHALWRWGQQAPGVSAMAVIDRTPGGPWPAARLPVVSYDSQPDDYPPLCRTLGFPVTFGDPAEYAKARRCVIDFGRPVRASSIEAAIAATSDWLKLARYGGWAPPDFDIGTAMVDLGNLAPYDDCSVELALSMYEASECAWYSLCNVLGQVSLDHDGLQGIEID